MDRMRVQRVGVRAGARHAGRGRGRGHARQLDRGRIVAAALELAREGGEAALSMRRVAGALDVDPAALYWHLRNKDELLAEVARAAAEAVPLAAPSGGSWQERAFSLCEGIRQQLCSRPELGLGGGSPWTTPFNARANGLLVDILAQSGLDGPPLLFAAQALLHEVTAIAQSQVLQTSSSPEEVRVFVRSVAEHLPEGSSAAWRGLSRVSSDESFDACFAFAIRALLDGIAQQAASP